MMLKGNFVSKLINKLPFRCSIKANNKDPIKIDSLLLNDLINKMNIKWRNKNSSPKATTAYSTVASNLTRYKDIKDVIVKSTPNLLNSKTSWNKETKLVLSINFIKIVGIITKDIMKFIENIYK